MNTHGLDAQIDGTAEHNDVLPALLGLCRLLDDLCARMTASALDRSSHPSTEQRDILLALLGAVSLRHTVLTWLSHCASSALSAESLQPPALERLLR